MHELNGNDNLDSLFNLKDNFFSSGLICNIFGPRKTKISGRNAPRDIFFNQDLLFARSNA